MSVRLHVGRPLHADDAFALPPGAARHAQVRRVQPGDVLELFDGAGRAAAATVLAVGRSAVEVRIAGLPYAVPDGLAPRVTLALGMPANERMDGLIEKATELGVAVIQPLFTERSVLRLAGERAERKQAHWQAVAEAACEQCGRARVPAVAPVQALQAWLHALEPPGNDALRLLLAPQPGVPPLSLLGRRAARGRGRIVCLSGPEGGLTDAEAAAAGHHGFEAASLGSAVLRADTAPLAALAWIALEAAAANRSDGA